MCIRISWILAVTSRNDEEKKKTRDPCPALLVAASFRAQGRWWPLATRIEVSLKGLFPPVAKRFSAWGVQTHMQERVCCHETRFYERFLFRQDVPH